MALYSVNGEEVVSRTMRDDPPTHFALRINPFFLLSNSLLERYDSAIFEADDYKWKLSLYPKGNKVRNGEKHISLYLEMSQTNSFYTGWEIRALFRFMILDQLRDKYLVIQDANGLARRFSSTNTQAGFDRLITLKEFNDPSKGFLVNDTCVFGVEVFVRKESVSGKGECLLMTAGPATCDLTWKIEKFSEFSEQFHSSQVFTAGGYKWRVTVHPTGDLKERGKSLLLLLELVDSTAILPGLSVYVEGQLRVLDQLSCRHFQIEIVKWFDASHSYWHWGNFISLSDLQDQSKGYLVNDVCIIEAHLQLIAAKEKLAPKSE